MEIIVNGEKKEATPGMSVTEYVTSIGFNPETVVVEYNSRILAREDYNSQIIEDGCILELIRFIGGG